MNKFLNLIANFLFKYRILAFLIAIMLTLIFGFYITKLKFDFSVDKIFLKTDKAHEFFLDTYVEEFSHLGIPCILAVSSDDPKTDLEKPLKEAFDFLVSNKNVIQVIAPFNQPFKEVFIAKNAHAESLVFFVDYELNKSFINNLRTELSAWQKKYSTIKFIVTGQPFIQNEMISLLQKDQIVFLPIVLLFIIVLLFFMTKHVLGAFYPLLVILIALIWTLGLLSFIGHEINVVNNSIIVLIIVIGIADSIHIYTRFRDEYFKINIKKAAVINTLKNMLLPCFLTTATTAMGFFASSSAGVAIIKDFGNDAAIGVLLCFLTTFLLMPALLYFHPIPSKQSIFTIKFWPHFLRIENMLRILVKYSLKYSLILVIISFIIFLGTLFLAKNIKSNQNFLSELKDTNKVSLDLAFIEHNFNGVIPFYIVFKAKQGMLYDYETFLVMDNLTQTIKKYPLQPKLNSLSEVVKPILVNLGGISKENFNNNRLIINNFLLSTQADRFFSKNKDYIQIEGSLKNASTEEIEIFREFLEQEIKKVTIDNLQINLTGSGLISSRALHNITKDMTKSTCLAVILILLFIAIIFKSIRYGLIAILPNILPISITLSFLYLFDIELRLATVMIFSMTLGLSIDNCLHLLCRIEEEKKERKKNISKNNLIKIIYKSFYGSGRAICYTTFILLGGFSIMAFSKFLALRDFAIISGITLFTALLLDIILFPALLLVSKKYFGK
jgi:predicted RND superfamily exporter protein